MIKDFYTTAVFQKLLIKWWKFLYQLYGSVFVCTDFRSKFNAKCCTLHCSQHIRGQWCAHVDTIVSCKYNPFANLALVQNAWGGLYVGCDNFSRDYALPFGHEVIVGVGWGPSAGPRRARGGEMLTTLAVG